MSCRLSTAIRDTTEVVTTSGLPPHDESVEEAVIAAILLDSDTVARVAPILTADDFFREDYRWCYEAATALYNRSEAITVPTLAHELDRAGRLDEIGGEGALIDIQGRHFTAIGVESHARIVARDARYRAMITASGKIAQLAYKGGPDAAAVLSESIGLLGGLVERRDLGLERLGDVEVPDVQGIEWGIPAMDRYTLGAAPGQVTIIAGRTGSGKSMLAAQIARNVAENGGKVLIFTMEMGKGEYQQRIAHAISAVPKRFSRYGTPYSEMELGQLDEAKATMGGWQLWSSDRPSITVPIVSAAARLSLADGPIALIVVDYLQLMGMPETDNEASALKQTTAALKALAVEVGCHVIIVSQMNRAAHTEMRGKQNSQFKCIVTDNPYPEPFVESLMGGAVENDADLVVMLQRHSNCPTLNHMEVCIVKNRNGISGHGMMVDEYAMCRLRALTEKECFDVAGGDLGMSRRLRIDACLLRDDWRDHEVAVAADAAEGWEPASGEGPSWAKQTLDEAFSR